MQAMGTDTFVPRVMGAARLDRTTYEEVEHDNKATVQAALVVAIAAISTGIGAIREDGGSGLIGGTLSSLFGWAVGAALIYFAGTRIIPSTTTEANLGQVLRTLGFASAPGFFAFLLIVPGIGGLLSLLVGIWGIVATVIAIMCALEMSALRAIATAIIASLVGLVVGLIVAAIFGIGYVGLSAVF